MLRFLKYAMALVVVGGLFAVAGPQRASAQVSVAVTSYYAPAPVITYYPVRYGLFGRRVVYRPFVPYVVPVAPAPVTAFYAPAPVIPPPPVVPFFPPVPVTSFYMPYFP